MLRCSLHYSRGADEKRDEETLVDMLASVSTSIFGSGSLSEIERARGCAKRGLGRPATGRLRKIHEPSLSHTLSLKLLGMSFLFRQFPPSPSNTNTGICYEVHVSQHERDRAADEKDEERHARSSSRALSANSAVWPTRGKIPLCGRLSFRGYARRLRAPRPRLPAVPRPRRPRRPGAAQAAPRPRPAASRPPA